MTFARRKIELTFQLGKGAFGESGFDTVTLRDLRVSASITKAGGVSMSYLQLRVYGLSLSLMNRLSTLGKPLKDGRDNKVTVAASDEGGVPRIVFVGTISEAWVDMSDAPNGAFVVAAHTGLFEALKPVPPSSYPGQADAATILASLAQTMGLAFENSGVSVILSNPYYSGTARTQVEDCATEADIYWTIDDGVLAIWPKTGSRQSRPIVFLSPENGLVGYPAHTQNGVALTTLFNPSITFGGRVTLQSSLLPVVGTWTIFSVAHEIESEVPQGKWFTRMECSVLEFAPLPR